MAKRASLPGLSITADDNFNIGSLTKQFTAFAVLDLFYKGKFSENDSIGKYLKLPFPVSSARIFQLLSHCSGIPDHYGFVDTGKVKHATDKDVCRLCKKQIHFIFHRVCITVIVIQPIASWG